MFVDNQKQLAITVPVAGSLFSFPTAQTLNGVAYTALSFQSNDGTDTAFGWELGEGERIYMQFETATPLVDAGGGATGVLNFSIVLSDVANLISANTQVLGQAGGEVVIQAFSAIGYTAARFAVPGGYNTVGNSFSMEIPGYTAFRNYEFQSLPYLGVMLSVPNFNVGGNTGFSAGAFLCRLVKDVQRNPLTRYVRPRMVVA